ncbi:MAG: ABC transporter permease [bacterium]|nr:ABC transporter permease [bacterium]
MNKTLQVALVDLRTSLREPGTWLNLIVIPVILIFAVGVANGAFAGSEDDETRFLVDVFDQDNTDLSAQFLQSLRQVNEQIVLCPLDQGQIMNRDGEVIEDICQYGDDSLTPELADNRVTDGVTTGIIEIPQGFEQSVIDGQPLEVVYRSDENPTQPSVILQAVQAAAQRVSAASVAAQTAVQVYEESGFTFADDADRLAFRQQAYDEAANLWSAPPATIAYSLSGQGEQEAEPTGVGGGFRQSVPGMGTMYVMFTVLAGAVTLITERKNWTFQRLVMMPVRRSEILLGKVLARFGMGMLQYGVAFGFGIVLSQFLGFNFGGNAAGLLLMMVAFTICISAVTFLLATLVENDQQAAGITLFFALTMAPLGGAWWPLEIVPEFMRTVGHISPVAWAMDGFSDLIFYNRGISAILPEVAVLLGASVVIFAIAVSRFRYD